MAKYKSGAEYRKDARARAEKFKRSMAEKGYKNLTVFVSGEIQIEFDRLKAEKGYTRREALEHIFRVYKCNVTGNATVDRKKTLSDNPPPNQMPEYRDWLFAKITDLKDAQNLTYAQISLILNDAGLPSTGGIEWTGKSVRSSWRRWKERFYP